MKDKFILDACCGPRMMWFNKHHPNAVYIDNRIEEKGFVDNRQKREIQPDIKMDFTKMDFPDKSFKLVVMDPPHLKASSTAKYINKCRLVATYGYLKAESWQDDLTKGLKECFRVLDDYGVLIFKWNDHDIKLKYLLPLFPQEPLFAQKTAIKYAAGIKKSSTLWFCFMKIPYKKLEGKEMNPQKPSESREAFDERIAKQLKSLAEENQKLKQEIKDIRNTFKEACRCCDRIKEKDKIIIDDTDLLLKRLEEIKKLKQQQQIKKLFEENK